MNREQKKKILIVLLIILLILIIFYNIHKNEFMTIDDDNYVNDNVYKTIFYTLLSNSLNLEIIPNEINLDGMDDNKIQIIKSRNLNNYLLISNNTFYLYMFDENSFIVDNNILTIDNSGNKLILNIPLNLYEFTLLSISDDYYINLKDPNSSNIKKIRLVNNVNNISNLNFVILIKQIRESMTNYLSSLFNEFKNININNINNEYDQYDKYYQYKQISIQKNSQLNGLILVSNNLLHYLFADKSGFYKVSLTANNNIVANITQIRILNSKKILFTNLGNLISYDDNNKVLYTLIKQCNKNITTLKLSNSGKLIFTDNNNNIYNTVDFIELKLSINKDLLLPDLESFDKKINRILNSINKINFTYNISLLNSVNLTKQNYDQYNKTTVNNINNKIDTTQISGLYNLNTQNKMPIKNMNDTDVPQQKPEERNLQMMPQQKPEEKNLMMPQQKPEERNLMMPQQKPEERNLMMPQQKPEERNLQMMPQQKPEERNLMMPQQKPYSFQNILTPYYYTNGKISNVINKSDNNITLNFPNTFTIKNNIVFVNNTQSIINSITFDYNITVSSIGLWIYIVDKNGNSISGWDTIYSYNSSFTPLKYNLYLKPNQGLVFNIYQVTEYGGYLKLKINDYTIQQSL